jgi:hypothetical protein
MTEDDAKTKWCPMARVAYPDGPDSYPSINRLVDVANPGPCRCIGSDCMMWTGDSDQVDEPRHGSCGLKRWS